MRSAHQQLAAQLAERFKTFPQVEAIAMAESQTIGGAIDPSSDIDLYIYLSAVIPLTVSRIWLSSTAESAKLPGPR